MVHLSQVTFLTISCSLLYILLCSLIVSSSVIGCSCLTTCGLKFHRKEGQMTGHTAKDWLVRHALVLESEYRRTKLDLRMIRDIYEERFSTKVCSLLGFWFSLVRWITRHVFSEYDLEGQCCLRLSILTTLWCLRDILLWSVLATDQTTFLKTSLRNVILTFSFSLPRPCS